jgi:DNA repair protein RecN (Recombination protein N)
MLKELGDKLVDVHSQHQNLLLNKQDFQLSVADIIASDEQQLSAYQQAYADYQAVTAELHQAEEDIERNRQNADFLQFQFDELHHARLSEGEQEDLEQKSDTMTHSEEIKAALFTADHALQADGTGIVTSLRTAISALRDIQRVYPDMTELTERLDSTYIELKDIAQDINGRLEDVDFDPSELDAINARLDKIYDLEKKYHAENIT